MKCAAKKPVQLRLCRQKKCPTHLRLRAYLIKCLETTRRPWIKINFQRIAETFGVTERTLRSAKKRLERDNDLKFRTLSKARGSGWQVIVALEANLLWDKEPLFYKKQQEKFRSRNVKDRHSQLIYSSRRKLEENLKPRPEKPQVKCTKHMY